MPATGAFSALRTLRVLRVLRLVSMVPSIGGAALFTFLSLAIDPNSPARIAAQVISGIGFLGAGMLLKSDGGTVTNLTTAAAVWFAAAVGMAIGFGWFLIAGVAPVYAIVVPRIPHISKMRKSQGQADEE